MARSAPRVKVGRATGVAIRPGRDVPNDRHVPLPPGLFSCQTLARIGK